jgi:hypothetical protein
MDRRTFLRVALGGIAGSVAYARVARRCGSAAWAAGECVGHPPPAYSIIPVVGDGKWIWRDPPERTGYLEPRPYEVEVGVEFQGTGPALQLRATTTAPTEHPEQRIDDVRVEALGCEAALRELAPGAGQLMLAAPRIEAGQIVRAVARYRVTLFKHYHGYQRDQFPYAQTVPPDVRRAYLGRSPGIETDSPEVRRLAAQWSSGLTHPWEIAEQFARCVPEHIEARIGRYTSVTTALRQRVGDCEERSATFVALCRAVGIPARLVWVPNHNWAEFYLTDRDGQGHWIAAHTSCYSWFGWVGAHELVLQKGDRIHVPERRRQFRLLEDWASWVGSRPHVRWTAALRPLPMEGSDDAGPGARWKDDKGEWVLIGEHPDDRYLRR